MKCTYGKGKKNSKVANKVPKTKTWPGKIPWQYKSWHFGKTTRKREGMDEKRDLSDTLVGVGDLVQVSFCFKVTALQTHKILEQFSIALSLKWDSGAMQQSTLSHLEQELQRLEPISAMGLFTVERATITSMFSTAITYIIILVQFRMSFWKEMKN